VALNQPQTAMSQTPEAKIVEAGFPAFLHGFSAIDAYLERGASRAVHLLCGADLVELARMFEGLRYPGVDFADAALDFGGKTWYFRCEDLSRGVDALYECRAAFGFLEFYLDCKTRRFYDPNETCPVLRGVKSGAGESENWKDVLQNPDSRVAPRRAITDGAMILARYFPEACVREANRVAAGFARPDGAGFPGAPPGAEEQRLLLTELLDVQNPTAGFEFLKTAGFIALCWPELAAMDDVDQSKEFHPEGNVWRHTLETLRHRKPAGQNAGFDLRLSLGLLLHDVGKPLSRSAGTAGATTGAPDRRGQNTRRPFDGHAELGERQARRFLERLGFDLAVANDVCYLVRNHMLPAALPRLPLFRTGEKMASPLFPLLMELYRCDESSSFKGLDGYYQSSAAYQSFLKHRRNPYRSPDGKKLKR